MLAVSREESCQAASFIVDVVTIILCTTVTAVTCAGVVTTTGPGIIGYHGNASNISSREEMPDEQRLLVKLLRSYDPGIRPYGRHQNTTYDDCVERDVESLTLPGIRPVFNISQSVVVNFSLTLVQIMDMVTEIHSVVSQSVCLFQLIFLTVELFRVSIFFSWVVRLS